MVIGTAPAGKPLADNASTRTVFDIVVSIHAKNGRPSYPAGDDDATQDAGASDDEQNAYEDIIRFFADGVCEMTNGAHHLGEVRIFKRGQRASSADIVWKVSDWPRGTVSGFGKNGQNIIFGDFFPFPGNTFDALKAGINREKAGYTLAHEWGHYTLGLFDEYKGDSDSSFASVPRKSDVPPPFPAIMNNQWPAARPTVPNRFRYLNLSQKDNFSKQTAQGRVYGRSAWDVVRLPAELDPKAAKTAIGSKTSRVHYTSLDGKAPAPKSGAQSEPNYKIELPTGRTDCRKDLKIIWMGDDIEMVLAMDTSVSMQFVLGQAQTAAKALVDIVPTGKTTMGLLHFNTNVTRDRPLTAIANDPGAGATVRNDFKTAIDGYKAEGSTKLFDGTAEAILMLDEFLAANLTKAIRMVFVLSDGDDTTSKTSTEASVIASAQGSAISLSTFAYGDDAPGAVLRRMASKTGGVFRQSPTNAADVLSAFVQALKKATDLQLLTVNKVFTGGGFGAPRTASIPFEVDSTVGKSVLLASFARGDTNNVSLSVDTPSGPLSVPFSCDSLSVGTSGGGETICQAFLDTAAIDAAGRGTWTFKGTNDTGTGFDFNLIAMSQPKDGESFDVTVDTSGQNELSYPDPIPVTAAVKKGGRPITGVKVEAARITSTGARESFAMNDLGTEGDAVPGDGIYTGLLNYDGGQFAPDIGTQTIEVTVSNPNNTATFTDSGYSPAHGYPFIAHSQAGSIGKNGGVFTPQSGTLVGENFTRSGTAQITLLDNAVDNHGDNTGTATPLTDDNVPIKGRIDSAGDIDAFHIAAPNTAQDLVVRLFNMSLGMVPKVTVLDSSAFNVLASGTIGTAQSQNGYLSLTIAKADLAGGIFILVEHADATASQGNYEISAGPAIEGDTTAPPPTLVSAILPSSRSVQRNQTVTVFMTILNASDNPAHDIGAVLKSTGLPITDFAYQATSALTNVPIGQANTPVFLDGRQGQTYVVSFRPFNVIDPTNLEFDASSFNAAPITPIVGVNTLQFRAAQDPVIDLIAVAATLNNDGYADIPGNTGTGVFSVATTNLGISGQVTVRASTGAATVPVSVSLCQTDAVGACMAPPSATLDLAVNTGETPTFGVFVTGTGPVADDPAANRVFLEFADQSGALVGSTSVAVRTVAAP